MDQPRLKVAVIGGGLVGSLSASFFALRGHTVHLYEFRDDIRQAALVQGRSINLAMSARARSALRVLGLEKVMVEKHGIPMVGRMIHPLEGSLHSIPYDPQNKQCIYSVSRKYLNGVLLTAAEKYPNVTLHFNHKLVSADLEEGQMTFQLTAISDNQIMVQESADLIVGADGAFSAVRRFMLKQPMFDYNQTYIEHGYLELCIPATKNNEVAMTQNYLHIWPRGTFMLIALPNQDNSWTVTLFMPFRDFATLDTPERLLKFFSAYFPDAVSLIGAQRLVSDFFKTKPSTLVSIKCRPYHVRDKAVIIGDAAHAMVPFYGQGMNAGFEDCLLLDKLMLENKGDVGAALQQFSAVRSRDAEAICDLAVYNYIEMRDLVSRKSFLLRKKLDTFLHWLMPTIWMPLYSSVTFSDMRYHQCIANKQWQDKMVKRGLIVLGTAGMVCAASALYIGLQASVSPGISGEFIESFFTLHHKY